MQVSRILHFPQGQLWRASERSGLEASINIVKCHCTTSNVENLNLTRPKILAPPSMRPFPPVEAHLLKLRTEARQGLVLCAHVASVLTKFE